MQGREDRVSWHTVHSDQATDCRLKVVDALLYLFLSRQLEFGKHPERWPGEHHAPWHAVQDSAHSKNAVRLLIECLRLWERPIKVSLGLTAESAGKTLSGNGTVAASLWRRVRRLVELRRSRVSGELMLATQRKKRKQPVVVQKQDNSDIR